MSKLLSKLSPKKKYQNRRAYKTAALLHFVTINHPNWNIHIKAFQDLNEYRVIYVTRCPVIEMNNGFYSRAEHNIIRWRLPGDSKYSWTPRLARARGRTNMQHI